MSQFMNPQIILLKEGTDTSQGRGQLISNINACEAVADVVRTTLGPRGMDKLIHDQNQVTISNDGASIMKLLDIVHPAARTLVDISLSQDSEVGDGTTSVVLLAGELLKSSKQFVEAGVPSQIIIRGFRRAVKRAVQVLNEIAVELPADDKDGQRTLLENCAGTALNSKLICRNKVFFAAMCVDAVQILDQEDLDLTLVGIKKVAGGSVTESQMVHGVAFKKTFAYAGFEQQPKSFDTPKILILNVELELKSEKENAEVRISDPSKYQAIVDAEWRIIYEKLDKCVESGAQIILSKLPIGDLATQYFADRGLFCAGRVEAGDLRRVSKATGAKMQTSVNDLNATVLGECGRFEEVQIGAERYNMFKGCATAVTSTIFLRGGADQFLDEAHRSIWDSLCIVKRCIECTKIVSGGGAAEMEVMRALRDLSRGEMGKQQLIIAAFAKAMEIIPRQLADNAGFDTTDIMNRLRQKHCDVRAEDPAAGRWFGVDVDQEGVCDTFLKGVWEPVNSKIQAVSAACEAACLVLSVDETVRNPQSEQAQMQGRGQMGGKGGKGAPMSQAMGGQGMRGMGMAGGGGNGMKMMRGKGGK